jgi:hypothetical protein
MERFLCDFLQILKADSVQCRAVTEGKIHVELERARLTRTLAKIRSVFFTIGILRFGCIHRLYDAICRSKHFTHMG